MTSASTSSEPVEQTAEADQVTYRPPATADLVAQLPDRVPPMIGTDCLRHGKPPATNEPVVVMHQSALLQANAHALSNVNYELGGALLGHAYKHEGIVYVEVKAALPATSVDHGPVHFTFSADSWSQLQRDRAAHYPNLDIIGWFHTHPDLGVFYSGDDVVVHSAAFTLPWHIGLVIDPLRDEASFFGWVDGRLQPIGGFWELPERQHDSIVTWRVVKSAVWDNNFAPSSTGSEAASQVYLANGQIGYGVSPSQVGLILGALGLGLALLLWLAAVVPLQRQVKTLETTVLALADTSLASTNALSCPDPRLRLVAPITGQSFPMGSTVPLVGTAALPNANRYEVELRPLGSQTWALLDRTTRDARLAQLATWNTTGYAAGPYEIRLSAVDLNNIRLANASPCSISVELVP